MSTLRCTRSSMLRTDISRYSFPVSILRASVRRGRSSSKTQRDFEQASHASHTHVCTSVYTHVRTLIRTCVCTHFCMHVYAHVYTHGYANICTHVHTHMDTHVHTHVNAQCLYRILHKSTHMSTHIFIHMSMHLSPRSTFKGGCMSIHMPIHEYICTGSHTLSAVYVGFDGALLDFASLITINIRDPGSNSI